MIYFVQAEGIGHIKIGFTDQDKDVRISQLQTSSPVPLKLVGTIPGTLEDEKNLHRKFAAHHVHGEWFKPSPELLMFIAQTEQSAESPISSTYDGLKDIANAITLTSAAGGRDANGGYVGCLTEAVMGITATIADVASALREVAAAIQEHGSQ